MAKPKGIFSFDDLDKAMIKIDSLGSIITHNEFSKIGEWIGLGNYLLNAQICGDMFGGMPSNRSILLAGETGCLSPDSEVEVFISTEKINRKIIEL